MNREGRDSPKVFVVTLNWNGRADTVDCVASLRRMDYPNFEIVVVDNGSTDGSVAALRAHDPGLTIIENGRNLGYALGFNTGMAYAFGRGADYVLIMNNDTVIDAAALTELVAPAEARSDVGFVTGKVYWHKDPNRLQSAGKLNDPIRLVGRLVAAGEIDAGQVDEVREYDFVDDVFLLVRRSVYDRVGGYDPNFFLYFEETDWCARVRHAGLRIVFTPRAKIWHKGQVGGPSGALSPMRHYYLVRNEIVFVRRNAPAIRFLRYAAWAGSTQIANAARFFRHGRLRHGAACLRGLGSGLWWACWNWRRT